MQDNGPAREDGNARKLQDAGAVVGDPFEISTMRREDVAFHKGRTYFYTPSMHLISECSLKILIFLQLRVREMTCCNATMPLHQEPSVVTRHQVPFFSLHLD